jgi:hypothetical protein
MTSSSTAPAKSKPNSKRRIAKSIPMPRLSDDAAIQIHDFLHHILDVFEVCYGDQIHRFYEDLCGSCCANSQSTLNFDDPPF